MKRNLQIVYIIIPFILIGVIFFSLYTEPLYIISNSPKVSPLNLVLSGYSDKAEGGHSVMKVNKDNFGKVIYEYTLKEGAPFPYIGIQLAKKDSTFFDLSSYSHIKIKVKSAFGTRVPFTITSDIKGFSKKEVELSYRTSQYILNVDAGITEIKAPINEFMTPDWWFTANGMSAKDLSQPDFSKVRTIQMNNCINLKKDINDRVVVEEVIFYYDLKRFFIGSAIFMAIYYGLGFYFLKSKKKTIVKNEINFQYEKTDVINYKDKDEEAVFGFIIKNYNNADLTIIDVQKGVGIHERKISTIIKNKTELNFKQFLNKLRITEAKRLLIENTIQIAEIAFMVGYGNASHFNRVFKVSENCTPNDFRKEFNLSQNNSKKG